MGYQFYYVELWRKDGEFPDKSQFIFDGANSRIFSDPSHLTPQYPFFSRNSCRESMITTFGRMSSLLTNTSPVNHLLGIRCFGEQHHAVSRVLMDKPENAEKVANVLGDCFGIKIEIEPGDAPGASQTGKFPLTKAVSFIGEHGRVATKLNTGLLTMYYRSWENNNVDTSKMPLVLCALIGILREPFLCIEIIEGRVTDIKSLAKAVLKLAANRATGDDDTFVTFGTVSGFYEKTLPQIQRGLKENCKNAFTGDGYDYLSIAYLAVFLFLFHKNRISFGLYISGPVSASRNALLLHNKKSISGFRGFVRSPKLLETISQRLMQYTSSGSPETIMKEVFRGKTSKKEAQAVS